MLKAGIVGLPNVGKSTLFNAVTCTRKAEAANYPFCTIDPNVGIVTVPDARLEPLASGPGLSRLRLPFCPNWRQASTRSNTLCGATATFRRPRTRYRHCGCRA